VGTTEFGNQCNEGVVLIPQQKIVLKEIPDALQYLLLYINPVLLVKQSCETIKSRDFG
jgi:hypothetical protein